MAEEWAWLARLYDAHAEPLYRFLLQLTRSEAAARDHLHDLFLKLTRRRPPELAEEEMRRYLFRAAYRLFVDGRRRWMVWVRKHEEAALEGPVLFLPEDFTEPGDGPVVEAALAELPPEQRAVVHLKIWQEMTFQEIATALDISPNTAASRYRYALDKLEGRLRSLQGDHEQA